MELTVKAAAAELGIEVHTVKRICRENGLGRLVPGMKLRLLTPADLPRIAKLKAIRPEPGRPKVIRESTNGTPKKAAKKASRRKSLSGKRKKSKRNA